MKDKKPDHTELEFLDVNSFSGASRLPFTAFRLASSTSRNITNSKTYRIAFNVLCAPYFAKNNKRWTMARIKNTKDLMLCFLPELSEVSGYKIGESHAYSGAANKAVSQFGLKEGVYKILIDEPVEIKYKDFVFYPIEFISE